MPSKLQSSARQTKQVPSCPLADKLTRRSERLLERRRKQALFCDLQKTHVNFELNFDKKTNRTVVFDLAASGFRHEDALFLGPPGPWPELRNHQIEKTG